MHVFTTKSGLSLHTDDVWTSVSEHFGKQKEEHKLNRKCTLNVLSYDITANVFVFLYKKGDLHS